jgi:hypothetical protein
LIFVTRTETPAATGGQIVEIGETDEERALRRARELAHAVRTIQFTAGQRKTLRAAAKANLR